MNNKDDKFKKVISHAKEYGYIFQSSEIYDGLSAVYDYAQNGVELKNNIKEYWWKAMVQLHENIVGLDSAIFMHPTIWKASGHTDAFNDPLIDNKDSKKRYRADVLVEDYCEKLEKDQPAVAFCKDFSLIERMRYDFMIKLFGTSIDMAAIRRRYGNLFTEALWKELVLFKGLKALKEDGNRLSLTAKGYYYWVIMMREFFIGVNNFRDICRDRVKGNGCDYTRNN